MNHKYTNFCFLSLEVTTVASPVSARMIGCRCIVGLCRLINFEKVPSCGVANFLTYPRTIPNQVKKHKNLQILNKRLLIQTSEHRDRYTLNLARQTLCHFQGLL